MLRGWNLGRQVAAAGVEESESAAGGATGVLAAVDIVVRVAGVAGLDSRVHDPFDELSQTGRAGQDDQDDEPAEGWAEAMHAEVAITSNARKVNRKLFASMIAMARAPRFGCSRTLNSNASRGPVSRASKAR